MFGFNPARHLDNPETTVLERTERSGRSYDEQYREYRETGRLPKGDVDDFLAGRLESPYARVNAYERAHR